MSNKELVNGKILTIKIWQSGEDMTWQHSIPVDAFRKFLKEHTTEDADVVLDDLSSEHPIKITLVSTEEEREANINGLMWGDGCSRKWAERVVDGVPHPEGVEPDDEDDQVTA